MSTPLRNPLHERYAQARAKGMTQMQAAREAGYSTHSSANMSRVDRRPEIQARVVELQRETRERFDSARAAEKEAALAAVDDVEINIKWLVNEAVLVMKAAQDSGDAKGALDAIKTIAQLKGLHLGTPGAGAKGRPPPGDENDKPDAPRTLNLQILNQVLGGMGNGDGNGSAPKPDVVESGDGDALPALRDDGPLQAVRMLDGLAGAGAPTVSDETEGGGT